MILGYSILVDLFDNGIISNCKKDSIKTASIDVTLSNIIYVESPSSKDIDPRQENISSHLREVELKDSGYLLRPGEIILANTHQMLNLPNVISASFVLKSSIGRLFLNQIQSNFIDPGFYGSVTLELYNANKNHSIRITPYMEIGQIVFQKCEGVTDESSYKNLGRYNNNTNSPIISKGVK